MNIVLLITKGHETKICVYSNIRVYSDEGRIILKNSIGEMNISKDGKTTDLFNVIYKAYDNNIRRIFIRVDECCGIYVVRNSCSVEDSFYPISTALLIRDNRNHSSDRERHIEYEEIRVETYDSKEYKISISGKDVSETIEVKDLDIDTLFDDIVKYANEDQIFLRLNINDVSSKLDRPVQHEYNIMLVNEFESDDSGEWKASIINMEKRSLHLLGNIIPTHIKDIIAEMIVYSMYDKSFIFMHIITDKYSNVKLKHLDIYDDMDTKIKSLKVDFYHKNEVEMSTIIRNFYKCELTNYSLIHQESFCDRKLVIDIENDDENVNRNMIESLYKNITDINCITIKSSHIPSRVKED